MKWFGDIWGQRQLAEYQLLPLVRTGALQSCQQVLQQPLGQVPLLPLPQQLRLLKANFQVQGSKPGIVEYVAELATGRDFSDEFFDSVEADVSDLPKKQIKNVLDLFSNEEWFSFLTQLDKLKMAPSQIFDLQKNFKIRTFKQVDQPNGSTPNILHDEVV